MYYGTGGTTEKMQESLTAPMYRPKGYDCLYNCVPYSQEACLDAGKRLNLQVGGGGYEFADHYSTKGCYAYDSGNAKYAGMMYYGTGGTTEQMQESLTAPMYRPKGYDCAGALGGK